jgi:hypothetical protein
VAVEKFEASEGAKLVEVATVVDMTIAIEEGEPPWMTLKLQQMALHGTAGIASELH